MGSFVVESLLAIVLFSLAQRLGGNDLSIKRLRYRKAWFTAEILARVVRVRLLMGPKGQGSISWDLITITVGGRFGCFDAQGFFRPAFDLFTPA